MKMATVGETAVAVIRTSSGVYALDNACPHQGYGLTTGALTDEAVTCQWHNWKFDVRTGACIVGEEDVACHHVSVVDGEMIVEVVEPTDEEKQARLWPSLRRGLSDDYVGQIARDALRLMETGVQPRQIVADAVALTAPKADFGISHELAMAADCLALAEIREGEDRALPLVQGLSGLSEETRDRPVTEVPAGDASVDLAAAIEAEDVVGAMASVIGQLEHGATPAEIRHQFLLSTAAHHLSYGHGIIYTQKSFELLDRIGWEHAADVLPFLAERLVYSTREDTLPYMRQAMRVIDGADLVALANAPATDRSAATDPAVVAEFLAAERAPIEAAIVLVESGAGLAGLLDLLSLAVSYRLLNHDLDVEFDTDNPFGWLDITHGLTTAQAVRWALANDPGPHVARLALFATWLLFDTGRSERREGTAGRWTPQELHDLVDRCSDVRDGAAHGLGVGDLRSAIVQRRVDRAVAIARSADPVTVGEGLATEALRDGAGSFLVVAHLIKTVQAARAEAAAISSSLPLLAAARYLAAPRLERFVARTVAESVGFVRTGRPPRR